MMISHKSFTILPIALPSLGGKKFKPLIRNWRGSEPIKCNKVFDTRDESIEHAKGLIDDYFTSHKGLV